MKGQVQTMEPIVIVIVLGVIAAIGIVFYARITDTQADVDRERIEELQAIEVLKVVTTLPELSCAKSVTTDTYCIDLYKARAFSQLLEDEQKRIFYQPLFGTSKVEISYIHLPDGNEEVLELYDLLTNTSDTRASTTHFTVYDPLLEEHKMALLTVKREAR